VFADNVTTSSTVLLSGGILNTNAKTVIASGLASATLATKTLNISNSTINITGTGVCWNINTVATMISAGSTILLSNNTTGSRTFNGLGLTYNNLVIGGDTATNTLIMNGNNTFTGTVSSTKTVAHTIQFAGGSTQTVGGWTVTGSAGNVFNLGSTNTTVANLVLTGGGTINTIDYLNINYSNATPPNTWYPGLNSIKGTSVTGWMFPGPPSNGNFFLLF
jgi:hypothetical protein